MDNMVWSIPGLGSFKNRCAFSHPEIGREGVKQHRNIDTSGENNLFYDAVKKPGAEPGQLSTFTVLL